MTHPLFLDGNGTSSSPSKGISLSLSLLFSFSLVPTQAKNDCFPFLAMSQGKHSLYNENQKKNSTGNLHTLLNRKEDFQLLMLSIEN